MYNCRRSKIFILVTKERLPSTKKSRNVNRSRVTNKFTITYLTLTYERTDKRTDIYSVRATIFITPTLATLGWYCLKKRLILYTKVVLLGLKTPGFKLNIGKS